MQGRLCPQVDGKIQAFPWQDWRTEFPAARAEGLGLMEWTLDHERLRENPVMHPAGRKEILALCREYGLAIPSLTGDLFMQAPFYKASGALQDSLVEDMRAVVDACAEIGCGLVVMPLVDAGRLENQAQEDCLVRELLRAVPQLEQRRVAVIFESDYTPQRYRAFLDRLPPEHFGVNLDTGNSAALGFAHGEELALYGDRVRNVHIKDRLAGGGTTVPLGTGAADIAGTLEGLAGLGYAGNFILQTARAADGDHAAAIRRYREMTMRWVESAHPEGAAG